MTHDKAAAKDLYIAYQRGPVVFLPHYTKKYFVGPGYGEFNKNLYTAQELQKAGAMPTKLYLWLRAYEQ